jgi:hypothetical protein
MQERKIVQTNKQTQVHKSQDNQVTILYYETSKLQQTEPDSETNPTLHIEI